MTGLTAAPSPSESARFGLRVARLALTQDDLAGLGDRAAAAVADAARGHDLTIVRYPADDVALFAGLAAQPGLRAWYADTLTYWRWDREGPGLPRRAATAAGTLTERQHTDGLAGRVESVFTTYRNHYAANPLLDPADALAGYVEWVTDAVRAGTARWFTYDVDGAVHDATVAFAVLDTRAAEPDVMLAGVEPGHRRKGHYLALVGALMDRADDHGWPGLTISTQAHNVGVQAAWARLGWLPTAAVTTVHLVGERLTGEHTREDALP